MWWVLPAVLADLPVHCLQKQVRGRWRFHLGPLSNVTSPPRCGHHLPGTKDDEMADPSSQVANGSTYEVTLSDPDVATDASGQLGFWTMVYDEGFEVRINNKVFFAFSRFHASRDPRDNAPLAPKDVAGYASECDRTAPGWYSNADRSLWGCYYAVRHGVLPGVTASVEEHDVLPSVQSHAGTPSADDGAHSSPVGLAGISAQLWDDSVGPTQILGPAVSFLQSPNLTDAPRARARSSARDNLTHNASATAAAHRHVVDALRRLHNGSSTGGDGSRSGWSPALLPRFAMLSLDELSEMAGGRAEGKPRSAFAQPDNRPHAVKYDGLPTHWDWRNVDGVNYLPQVRTQGSCGSCYAIAAVVVLESRLRIATANEQKPNLSPQDVVSCSPYSQGCDGGFPYLVGKYLQDFGVVSDTCFPYQKRVSCARRCAKPEGRWHAANYRYVGGRYGSCNEVDMMREIYENGPIAVGFEAGGDLFYYSEGIYSSVVDAAFLELSSLPDPAARAAASNLRAWQHTNHAVVAVGWGAEVGTGRKYWIAMNTWGPEWGEHGFFRIARGEDESAFESMSVAVDVILPPSARRPSPTSSYLARGSPSLSGGRRRQKIATERVIQPTGSDDYEESTR